MREDDLSHRGLMKIISAKIDYLTELFKIEKLAEQTGEVTEIMNARLENSEKYQKRVRQIFSQDKLINERN